MTKKQALAEAKRRWGENGRIWRLISGMATPYKGAPVTCFVGWLGPTFGFKVCAGCGGSWEEAFEDAGTRRPPTIDLPTMEILTSLVVHESTGLLPPPTTDLSIDEALWELEKVRP